MKTKSTMSELDYLCDLILKTRNEEDFYFRLNHLINMAVILFETETERTSHLPFNSHHFIDKLNNKMNSIIQRINQDGFKVSEGYLMEDIFLLIIQEDFPEYYKNYIYQFHFRNN